MEKVIKVVLDNIKDVNVSINDSTFLVIKSTDRQVTAEQIYSLLNPQFDDTYKVMPFLRNENFDKDNDVANYFHNLIKEITDAINSIPRDEAS